MPVKRVAISCSASSSYDFFLPIITTLWRKHIGYEPLVFLVGTLGEWSEGHRKVVLDELITQRISIEFVGHVYGVSDATVSQSIRQHAAALQWLDPSDTMIVGDADVFPLNREYYNPPLHGKYAIAILHSDTYGDEHWPAHGLLMSVDTWREVMRLAVGDVRGSMLKTFLNGDLYSLILAKELNYEDSRLWYFDEANTSKKIRESRFSSSLLKVTAAGGEMLCRNGLSPEVDASKFVDLHCPRPGWSSEHWLRIRNILVQSAPNECIYFDQYMTRYMQSGPLIANPFA